MSQQQTSLAAAITTAGQSSITVTEYLGFPASGAFSILIDAELLRVTAGNGTASWTVSRGHGGTTAATHLIAATITHVPDAHADLGDLLATMALEGTGRYSLLLDMLVDTSRDLDIACLRTFAVPTADVTFTCDVNHSGQVSLVDAIGRPVTTDGRALDLVSVTTLEVRDSESGSYSTIAAGDTGYYLEAGPPGTGVAGTDWPYVDITLSPQCATAVVWPVGRRAVRIVGKPGWPALHPSVTRAVISETRERFRQSVSGGPAPAGVNQFGTPIFLTGDSPDMRRVTRWPFSLRRQAA